MHQYKTIVTKVVDGDTIKCDIDLGFDIVLSNQTVRLYGVDAPESRTKDKEEKYYGNLAKNFLKRYFKNNNIFSSYCFISKFRSYFKWSCYRSNSK